MLKPSEFTPKINALLEGIIRSVFPIDQVAIVNGDASIGATFSALPFDHLIFTGSTPVGHKVMQAASEHLVPVTLELGGKSPVIRKVLDGTVSGNVTINGTIMHIAQDDLPFGGVGASGMGAYHGIEGFRSFSHAKGIYVQGRWNLANLLHAPFKQPIDTILSLVLR